MECEISLDKIILGFTIITMLLVVMHWIAFGAHKIEVEYDLRHIANELKNALLEKEMEVARKKLGKMPVPKKVVKRKTVKATKTVKKVNKTINKKK